MLPFFIDLTTTAGLGCLGDGLKWVPNEGKCIEICEHNMFYDGADVAGPDGTKHFMLDGVTASVCTQRKEVKLELLKIELCAINSISLHFMLSFYLQFGALTYFNWESGGWGIETNDSHSFPA